MRSHVALLAPAALLLATTAALAPTASGAGRQPTTVTVQAPADTAVESGAAVSATGTVRGDKADRPLHLRLKTPNGWMKIGKVARTDTAGSYAIDVPTDWYYDGKVRVTVPRTSTHRAATSRAFSMEVGPSYTPVGDSADWVVWHDRARWNPCRTITYRVNDEGAPAGALEIVEEAVALVHQATGLRFRHVGATDAIPFRDDGAGPASSDADLDIAWATGEQVEELNGGTIGWGGVWWNNNQVNYYGGIALLRDSGMTSDPGPGGTWRNLVLHELGHVVGLDHASGDDQVMYPIIPFSPGAFQAGDLAGLDHVGADNGCQGGRARVRGSAGFAAAP